MTRLVEKIVEKSFDNKNQTVNAFNRVAKIYDKTAILAIEIGKRLLERLDFMLLQPKLILDLGSGTSYLTKYLEQRYRKAKILEIDIADNMLQYAKKKARWRTQQRFICADAYKLPLANYSADLIFSNLMLCYCLDLAEILREFKRVLKPDGLLLFSTLGPDTLSELRQSLAKFDNKIHIPSFTDMHDIGDSLIHTKFDDPVMDMEKITLTYRDVYALIHDLKVLGRYNYVTNRPSGLTGKQRLLQLSAAYETHRNENGVLPATFEIVYGQAWGESFSKNATLNSVGEVYIPIANIKNRPIW